MNRGVFIAIGIIATVLLLGWGGYFFFMRACPASCDDGNACTKDVCSEQTDYQCSYSAIPNCCGNDSCEAGENYETCAADCPNCDDVNECTRDSYDYHDQQCKNVPVLNAICCGNTVCETGEKYDNCARDCPNCDDGNKCTKDYYDYHKKQCVNDIIKPCCGNNICDKGAETNSICSADCPNCNDGNRLTADSFNYTTQKCDHVVTHYFIDDFESGLQNWSYHATSEDPTASWSLAKENGNAVFRGVGHNWALVSGQKWDNYALKLKFKVIKGGMHVNYRLTQKQQNPDRYFVYVDNYNLSLAKQLEENFYNDLANSPVSVTLGGGWHTMEIRGFGSILNIYIDGRLLMKYKDSEAQLFSGSVGLETHDNSEFLIDDVEVKVINSADVSYP